jgi:ABC-type transporter Mla maintaining outer membrane lipid asymmetry ATPase subunit MlaF
MDNEELLRLENVSYISDNSESLIDISFSLKKGDNLVLFGPENSGIDIICYLIAGLEDQFDGDIFYKNRPIKNFDYIEMHEYRKGIGYLQRDYGLINNMSVEENISLPLKYHSRLSSKEIGTFVNNLIEELNLGHCRKLRPSDLLNSETLKTAYARSIALNPDMLMIEHALESQCLINTRTFLDNLKKRDINEGKTIIFITYEPEIYFDLADKFIMLYNGNIVFSGGKNDLAAQGNRYVEQYIKSSLTGPMRIL